MTNKEATKHIKAAAKLAIDAGYSSDIVDACALAVRALEREPILDLDKIRAEIADLVDDDESYYDDDPDDYYKGYYMAVIDAIQVIYKYI